MRRVGGGLACWRWARLSSRCSTTGAWPPWGTPLGKGPVPTLKSYVILAFSSKAILPKANKKGGYVTSLLLKDSLREN